ncbi:hypothetical protein O6H91_16G011800 [Diphasiastrum complanatum]|nr:hypothetical protein O6H91_16G011800 [Diphasiastrum complanatum]
MGKALFSGVYGLNVIGIAMALCLCLFAVEFSRAELVPVPPLILTYHNGPVLSSATPIKLYLLFYGSFSSSYKSTIREFLASFIASSNSKGPPTVAKWWSLTKGYVDLYGASVSQRIELSGVTTDAHYTRGKILKEDDISSLVISSLKIFPKDSKAIYLILTAADVSVEGFCQNTCGEHFYTYPSSHSAWQMLPYAWVGNSETQCPGFCAWPYAKTEFGPNTEPLLAPNGVGVDGMIITIAKVLAGGATNPYGNAYYQGDASAALEAAGACSSSYGPGAYPGYPGDLLKDNKTGASYNVEGVMQRKFLVPWIWNPKTLACAGQP